MNKNLLKNIKNSKEGKNLELYNSNIKEIYWPKTIEEYKILLNSIKRGSIQYPNNLLKEKTPLENRESILIETNNLDSILSLSSDSIEVEVGTPITKIEIKLRQNDKTIHPFEQSELLENISFIEDNKIKKLDTKKIDDIKKFYLQNNIYSLNYKIYSIEDSKRVFYQYKSKLSLLNDAIKIKNDKKVSIYNNFASLLLKYETAIILSRKLWKDFREFFYYKTSLEKRRKNIIILKSLLEKYPYNSLAFNSRSKKDIEKYKPKEIQTEFSKKKDQFSYLISFLKNEFDRVELLNKRVELSIRVDNIYSFIKFVEDSDDIFFYEITIFKNSVKIVGLFISTDKKSYLKTNLFLKQLKE